MADDGRTALCRRIADAGGTVHYTGAAWVDGGGRKLRRTDVSSLCGAGLLTGIDPGYQKRATRYRLTEAGRETAAAAPAHQAK